jgi:hypothetical protein
MKTRRKYFALLVFSLEHSLTFVIRLEHSLLCCCLIFLISFTDPRFLPYLARLKSFQYSRFVEPGPPVKHPQYSGMYWISHSKNGREWNGGGAAVTSTGSEKVENKILRTINRLHTVLLL